GKSTRGSLVFRSGRRYNGCNKKHGATHAKHRRGNRTPLATIRAVRRTRPRQRLRAARVGRRRLQRDTARPAAGVQDPEGCWRGPARDRVLSPTCGAGSSVARLRRRKRAHAPDAATERTRAEDRTAAGGIAYQRSALIAQRRLTRRATVASRTPCPAALAR